MFRIAAGMVLLVCLLGGLPACGAGQTGAEPFEARLTEGTKLLGEGHLLESIKVLNSAKQSAPQDARPYFYCGMALAQAGRMRDAASELGEAVHLAPDQLHYRVFQAHVLEELKQTSEAQDEKTLLVVGIGLAAVLGVAVGVAASRSSAPPPSAS